MTAPHPTRGHPRPQTAPKGTNFGLLFQHHRSLCCSGNVLRRRRESPDDGRLPSLPPALAAGSTVTSAADAAIGSQFPLPSLQQDPQAGTQPLAFIITNLFPLSFPSSHFAQQENSILITTAAVPWRPISTRSSSTRAGTAQPVPHVFYLLPVYSLRHIAVAELPARDWRSTAARLRPAASAHSDRSWLRCVHCSFCGNRFSQLNNVLGAALARL